VEYFLTAMPPEITPDSRARLERIPAKVRHVHLIGVAGSAMAALAGMLTASGYRVSGSDNQLYEPTASLLKHLAIDLRASYDAANLAPAPDLVVVGNVITRSNPEAAALLATKIPYLSMPEALWHFFLRDRRVLMVAGTHGKTTSTAIMAHVLHSAGRDPSMLVGGMARDFGSNYRLAGGPDFVIEGDEYDTAFFDKRPKFLHYHAAGAIITSVEFDHADIYRDLAHVKSAFRALVAQMGSDSVLAVCADSADALEVSNDSGAKKLTYGLDSGKFCADEIAIDSAGAHFSVTHDNKRIVMGLHLPMGGRMNVANALGVWVLLKEFGLSDIELAQGLETFSGVARRQEIVSEVSGITIVDDFAHHPTAICATLAAIAERFPGRRILAAFEPRSNTTRRAVFQAAFATAFDRASHVYLAPVYFKENDPIPRERRLDPAALARAISMRGPDAFVCESIDALLALMLGDARSGDVIVCMSNGPFANLPRRLVDALTTRRL
jgi:UDP-N-acetylmuramate: L-alanyl-gamma-D-glutamyl-meso-diaminopimelate ligase